MDLTALGLARMSIPVLHSCWLPPHANRDAQHAFAERRYTAIIAHVFDAWQDDRDYPTLYRMDRDVVVDVARVFPASGIRKDELPLWVKSCGLLLDPVMPARQIAWVRRSDGGWLAAVEMPASSANGRSRLTMQLWLPPEALTASLGAQNQTGEE
jgi:hypothetical protein